jgi:hypothetical protein
VRTIFNLDHSLQRVFLFWMVKFVKKKQKA